ncbi:MAG: hypothetical protein ABL864_10570 [Terricaulis sp.]
MIIFSGDAVTRVRAHAPRLTSPPAGHDGAARLRAASNVSDATLPDRLAHVRADAALCEVNGQAVPAPSRGA